MGAANKVPGVSGGIVAFVGGFYEEFINSLQKVNLKAFKLLFGGRFKSFYRYVNGSFLTLLIFGMLVSYFSVSKLLDFFLERKELFVWAAFFGMIIGSIYYIGKGFKHWNKTTITAAVIGLIIGVSISFLSPAKENDNLLFVFLCGIISVSGMTLPGLSGSFILILLGNYVLLLVDSVNALYDTFADIIRGDFSFIRNEARIGTLKVLAVFTAGSATGLVTLSHLLSYVLKHYKHITTAVILGFITGSLGVVWPWKRTIYKTKANGQVALDSNGREIITNYERYFPDFGNSETWWALFFAIIGIAILLILDWYGKRQKKKFRYGLIGKNISYSFSKGYFTDKFKTQGLDNHSYENFDLLQIEDFESIVQKEKHLKGFNVTIPYKEAILPFLTEINPMAERIGAVNTIQLSKNGLKGFNTDAYGFQKSLEPHLKTYHTNALVLGTGGASKAILYVLNELGIKTTVISRTPNSEQISYNQLDKKMMQKHLIIINCTPLGTHPNVSEIPNIPYKHIGKEHLLFDLIYNPAKTAFLQEGEKRGASICNGLRMLELQAEKAWEIWTNGPNSDADTSSNTEQKKA